MKSSSLIFPTLLIVIGAIWFLKSSGILPPTNLMIAALLGVAGLTIMIMDGINKQSIVAGPMLIYAGLATYLYASMIYTLSPLIALGMVVLGLCMILARSNLIPHKSQPKPPQPH